MIIKRLKWLMWLFRAYSLLRSLRELVNFVDATHLMLQSVARELDKLCAEDGKNG